jgi:hypothetical protein
LPLRDDAGVPRHLEGNIAQRLLGQLLQCQRLLGQLLQCQRLLGQLLQCQRLLGQLWQCQRLLGQLWQCQRLLGQRPLFGAEAAQGARVVVAHVKQHLEVGERGARPLQDRGAKRLKRKRHFGGCFEGVIELDNHLRGVHGQYHELADGVPGRFCAQLQLLLHLSKLPSVKRGLQL